MQNLERINEAIATATKNIYSESDAVICSMVNREIQVTVGQESEVNVQCNDGVVTLRGFFATKVDKCKALRRAIRNPGVLKVINNAI